MQYPSFEYDPEKHVGVLAKAIVFPTEIRGYSVNHADYTLDQLGWLRISEGFEWDFGSGPAIDTVGMVAASLVHDVFCILTDNKTLPWKVRAKADKLFRKMLKEYGVGFMRRNYCYMAVRSYSTLKRLKK